MKHNSDFRYDLEIGKLHEKEFGKLVTDLCTGKIEIKSEQDIWFETKNIFVEYESRGKPSGISTTQANHWVVSFYKNNNLCFTVSVPIKQMKAITKKYYLAKRITSGGDDNTSKGVLVPLHGLLYFNYLQDENNKKENS
tara:strand:- start:6667 stop:7083 length:417 start_codon:yes stop_codon:yes gene_type:complete